MIVNIDPNGNIRVGGDTSSTSAKHFAVYLVALTGHISEVSYDETSAIKDASYDPETGVLSWLENGAQQTYSMNTPDLDVFTKTSFEYEGSFGDSIQELHTKVDDVKSYLLGEISQTLVDNYGGLYQHIVDCWNGINSTTAATVNAASNSLADKIDEMHTSTDQKVVEVGAKVDALQASEDLNFGHLTDRLIGQSNQLYSTMNHIDTSIDDAKTAIETRVDGIQASTDLSGEVAKLTWLAARCQMQRLDVLASLSLSKKKLDDYIVKAPEIRPDRMPTNETVNTFILSH